jgi:hypothetical protein
MVTEASFSIVDPQYFVVFRKQKLDPLATFVSTSSVKTLSIPHLPTGD